MGSASLVYKNPRNSSGWGGWRSISGDDYISLGNHSHVVFYITNSTSGTEQLTYLNLAFNIYATESMYIPSGYVTLKAYLYTFDPTGYADPPSGYIQSWSEATDVTASIMYPQAWFNVETQSSPLYVWVTAENNHPQGMVIMRNTNDVVTASYSPTPTTYLVTATPMDQTIESVEPSDSFWAAPGQQITLTAHPAYGYAFDYWRSIYTTEHLSTDRIWTFTMPARDLSLRAVGRVAQQISVNLVAGANITVVRGGGTKYEDEEITVSCSVKPNTAAAIYDFDGWYENGVLISSSQSYTFTASRNITLTARATETYRGSLHLFHNNAWQTYKTYIYHNGSWRFAAPLVKSNGAWRRSE